MQDTTVSSIDCQIIMGGSLPKGTETGAEATGSGTKRGGELTGRGQMTGAGGGASMKTFLSLTELTEHTEITH